MRGSTRWIGWALLAAWGSCAAACSACRRGQPEDRQSRTAQEPAGEAPEQPSAAPALPRAAPPREASSGATKTVRVYVAGESIERRNRWVEPPFTAAGALNARGGGSLRNDNDEYGWLVPMAERLRLRDPSLSLEWVGTDVWADSDDGTYSGTFPTTTPQRTSAISGTSIDSWLEQRAEELEKKRHCYQLAFAARGGNDFGLDDDGAVIESMKRLVKLLARGSSCKADPLLVVTAHMPDDQREQGQSAASLMALQRRRFVERFRTAVEQLRREASAPRVRFVDMYTPFVEGRRTTAFPGEAWTSSGALDFAKIGREGDGMHPRRLASIFAGEIVADALPLDELRSL